MMSVLAITSGQAGLDSMPAEAERVPLTRSPCSRLPLPPLPVSRPRSRCELSIITPVPLSVKTLLCTRGALVQLLHHTPYCDFVTVLFVSDRLVAPKA